MTNNKTKQEIPFPTIIFFAILVLILMWFITGCAIAKVNKDKPSWFIGWGKLKIEEMEIESSPPIKIGTIKQEN